MATETCLTSGFFFLSADRCDVTHLFAEVAFPVYCRAGFAIMPTSAAVAGVEILDLVIPYFLLRVLGLAGFLEVTALTWLAGIIAVVRLLAGLDLIDRFGLVLSIRLG